MNKEILMVVDVVSNEKGVSKEIIFEAIEAALASATKKLNREDIEARVEIDRETGNYKTYRCWEVVEDTEEPLEFPSRQITLVDAREKQADIEIGQFVDESFASVEFGRIAAQTAKQVIVQKVREAERSQVVEAYKDRVGEMVSGVVKRVERQNASLLA
jgi:N utilization substance protein A